jgi:putative iron-dependent peroxidase
MPNDIPEPQAVTTPINRSAIFIVATLADGEEHAATARAWCADVAALVRSVGKRVPSGNLSCVVGFSSGAWDTLFGAPRPAQLHPFREFGPSERRAIATPGDILLHIRADQMDLCFELATQLITRLGESVQVVDEVHGFRYFDLRSMVGFVDGTENPTGREAIDFTMIGDEDPEFVSGSYVLAQKYLHDMTGWNALSVETQERIIGRTKLSDIEQMLENMFVGRPPGNYDRLLDFSRAATGGLFFVPSAPLLEALADRDPQAANTADDASPNVPADLPTSAEPAHEGSLNIGSLKGTSQYE